MRSVDEISLYMCWPERMSWDVGNSSSLRQKEVKHISYYDMLNFNPLKKVTFWKTLKSWKSEVKTWDKC